MVLLWAKWVTPLFLLPQYIPYIRLPSRSSIRGGLEFVSDVSNARQPSYTYMLSAVYISEVYT